MLPARNKYEKEILIAAAGGILSLFYISLS
uniref:Uncharacterized protein n=1 Tax=Siphoviridae sp. ctf8W5 TaxID=2825595 RepID=A0A8S5Q870_9CAUD|nr:MAG TPA: hypothetical protein [Siphoviridae sp. ctf8W5]